MSNAFREMIAQAAARADEQITQIDRGEYRPKIQVITQGTDPGQARKQARATA